MPPTEASDFDTRIALIQALIPLALERVHEELHQEVTGLACLQTYERLQHPRALDMGLLHEVSDGPDTREYARCAEMWLI